MGTAAIRPVLSFGRVADSGRSIAGRSFKRDGGAVLTQAARGNAHVLMACATGEPPASGTSKTSPAAMRPVFRMLAWANTPPGGFLRRKLMLRLSVTASRFTAAPTIDVYRVRSCQPIHPGTAKRQAAGV